MHSAIMEALNQFVRGLAVEHIDDPMRLASQCDRVVAWTLEHVLAPAAVKSTVPVTVVTIVDRSKSMEGLPLEVARCFMRLNLGYLKLCHPSVQVILIAQDVQAAVLADEAELYMVNESGTSFAAAYELADQVSDHTGPRFLLHATDGESHEDDSSLASLWRRSLEKFDQVSFLEIERHMFGWRTATAAARHLSDREKERFTLSGIRIAF